ncbi:hypothetical protein BpHYR1_001533 [Brachionus plicatilis]|uniref:Uncharacterized protein n=1 Tax=Brachionus plicatilis TaxID=10195 RepID=A0A3M7QD65_BRAPC|nr:hypothetical protein BpHYR1_001533 [Brachionus plicatilis]
MFISNKTKLNFPFNIETNGIMVEVVDKFKLLGVTIDNKLTFLQHVNLPYFCEERSDDANNQTHVY